MTQEHAQDASYKFDAASEPGRGVKFTALGLTFLNMSDKKRQAQSWLSRIQHETDLFSASVCQGQFINEAEFWDQNQANIIFSPQESQEAPIK